MIDCFTFTTEGYVTQPMKQGALGVPTYRTFSLKELEDATNNFNTSTFMADGSYAQVPQFLLFHNLKHLFSLGCII